MAQGDRHGKRRSGTREQNNLLIPDKIEALERANPTAYTIAMELHGWGRLARVDDAEYAGFFKRLGASAERARDTHMPTVSETLEIVSEAPSAIGDVMSIPFELQQGVRQNLRTVFPFVDAEKGLYWFNTEETVAIALKASEIANTPPNILDTIGIYLQAGMRWLAGDIEFDVALAVEKARYTSILIRDQLPRETIMVGNPAQPVEIHPIIAQHVSKVGSDGRFFGVPLHVNEDTPLAAHIEAQEFVEAPSALDRLAQRLGNEKGSVPIEAGAVGIAVLGATTTKVGQKLVRRGGVAAYTILAGKKYLSGDTEGAIADGAGAVTFWAISGRAARILGPRLASYGVGATAGPVGLVLSIIATELVIAGVESTLSEDGTLIVNDSIEAELERLALATAFIQIAPENAVFIQHINNNGLAHITGEAQRVAARFRLLETMIAELGQDHPNVQLEAKQAAALLANFSKTLDERKYALGVDTAAINAMREGDYSLMMEQVANHYLTIATDREIEYTGLGFEPITVETPAKTTPREEKTPSPPPKTPPACHPRLLSRGKCGVSPEIITGHALSSDLAAVGELPSAPVSVHQALSSSPETTPPIVIEDTPSPGIADARRAALAAV